MLGEFKFPHVRVYKNSRQYLRCQPHLLFKLIDPITIKKARKTLSIWISQAILISHSTMQPFTFIKSQ